MRFPARFTVGLIAGWQAGKRGKCGAYACALLIAFASAPLHAQFTYTDLYDFNCSTAGCYPQDYGQLAVGPDGSLYGTTVAGSSSLGTVFKVTTSGSYSTLWNFDGTSGRAPEGGLTLATDGYFYGTTWMGGNFNYGTLFRVNSSGALTVLHHFTNGIDGGSPQTPPANGKDGNLYGTTGSGTTYKVTIPGGVFKALPYSVPGVSYSPLYLASDGKLYGTTNNGGSSNLGTIFSMTTAGTIKKVHQFSGADGADPDDPLTQDSDGNLYGTTVGGGLFSDGEGFQFTLEGPLTPIYSFANTDGINPWAGLVAAPGGLLGTTQFHGANGASGFGTIFEITTGGGFSKLFDFTGGVGPVNGANSTTTLRAHPNGSFYGLTPGDGVSSYGNLYRLSPTTGSIPILVVEGPIFVHPGIPVQILGDNLTQVIAVNFAGTSAQFQVESDTYMTATASNAAVDGVITATLATGLQVQTQMAVHILPGITSLDPSSGPVGTQVGIVGDGFAGATKITFGGVKATNFTVVSPALIQAIVPSGAKPGKVAITTPNGTATSKQTFTVQ